MWHRSIRNYHVFFLMPTNHWNAFSSINQFLISKKLIDGQWHFDKNNFRLYLCLLLVLYYQDLSEYCNYPEVVESSVGKPLSGDIFGQRFNHSWLLHSQNISRNEFSVISNSKMPWSDSHHVVKRKLDNQSTFSVHLLMK